MIDDDDQFDAAIYISLKQEARFIRIMDDLLIPTRLSIRADISPSDEASSAEITTALLKIQLWLEHVVPRCVAFSADNEAALDMFFDGVGGMRSSNQMMLTPGSPSDDVLATLFLAKMQALAGEDIEFSMCRIESDNAAGLNFTFVGDPYEILPEMKDWLGVRNYFAVPWWGRDDATTFDVVPPADADLTVKPEWALPVIPAYFATAPAIVRPGFKPIVIDGGKKPDA